MSKTNETVNEHGTLNDYKTGEVIRPATADELAASKAAGDTGVITVDGRSCYVSE